MFDDLFKNNGLGLISVVLGGILILWAAQDLGISQYFISIVVLILGIKLVVFGLRKAI